MHSSRLAFFLAGWLLTVGAAAAGESSSQPFDISTPESFQAQAMLVRAGMNPDGAYGFLSMQDRARVQREITAMNDLFQRYGTVQAMDDSQRVELYNAQETVNRILTRGQAGTTRCAWTQQTGSHIPRTQCWSNAI